MALERAAGDGTIGMVMLVDALVRGCVEEAAVHPISLVYAMQRLWQRVEKMLARWKISMLEGGRVVEYDKMTREEILDMQVVLDRKRLECVCQSTIVTKIKDQRQCKEIGELASSLLVYLYDGKRVEDIKRYSAVALQDRVVILPLVGADKRSELLVDTLVMDRPETEVFDEMLEASVLFIGEDLVFGQGEGNKTKMSFQSAAQRTGMLEAERGVERRRVELVVRVGVDVVISSGKIDQDALHMMAGIKVFQQVPKQTVQAASRAMGVRILASIGALASVATTSDVQEFKRRFVGHVNRVTYRQDIGQVWMTGLGGEMVVDKMITVVVAAATSHTLRAKVGAFISGAGIGKTCYEDLVVLPGACSVELDIAQRLGKETDGLSVDDIVVNRVFAKALMSMPSAILAGQSLEALHRYNNDTTLNGQGIDMTSSTLFSDAPSRGIYDTLRTKTLMYRNAIEKPDYLEFRPPAFNLASTERRQQEAIKKRNELFYSKIQMAKPTEPTMDADEAREVARDAMRMQAVEQLENEMKKKDDILQCFYDIVSSDEATRIKGIATLISTLQELQEVFRPEHHADVSKYVPKVIERVKIDDDKFSPELNYTIKRLVLGLSSSRDFTKMGFSLALTELLNAFPVVQVQWLFDTLAGEMDLTGRSMPEREACFGRLFGIMAIIKSGRIDSAIVTMAPTKSSIYNYNAPDSSHMAECLIEQLIYISKKRAAYTELAYEVLSSLIDVLAESNFDKIFPFIKPIIPTSIEDYTPEILVLLFSMTKSYKKFNLLKHASGWNHSSMFNISNLPLLKKLYGDSAKSHPRVHKVWRFTFQELLEDREENATLLEFWKIIVDNNLFNSSSSQKKSLGLQLFEMMLQSAPTSCIGELFSPHVCFYLNESLKTTSPLHEIGTQVFQSIPRTAELSSAHRLELILFFSGKGNESFDNHIPVDVITELVKEIDRESAIAYMEHIYNTFYNPRTAVVVRVQAVDDTDEAALTDGGEDEGSKTSSSQRNWALNQCSYLLKELVKRPSSFLATLEPAIANLLNFLYFHAFFVTAEAPAATPAKGKKAAPKAAAPVANSFVDSLVSREPVPELTQSVRDTCATRFFSILEELSSISLGKVDGTMSDGNFWAGSVVSFQAALMMRPSRPQLVAFVPAGLKPLDKVVRVLTAIQKQPAAERSTQARGFELLFLHVTLQYIPDPVEIGEILDDLVSSYEDIMQVAATPTKKVSKKDANKPSPFMVLLDILVSLLDKQSHILRTIVKQVFTIFVEHITLPVLEHIIGIITSPVSDLFDGLEDDDEEEDDDFKPIDSDDQESGDDEPEENKDDEESDASDDEEEDSDESDDDTVNPELVEKLKKSLGPHLLMGDDDSDDDAKPPTAAEAKQLDMYLSQIFKSRKEKKANFHDIKSKTLNLKIRLIDLLEVYVKRYTASPNQTLFQIVPLMINASTSEEPAISNRLVTLFKHKISQIRTCTDPSVNPATLNALIATCFDNIASTKKMSNTDKEAKPFYFLLSGHTLYMAARVLMSMPAPVAATPAKKGKAVAAPVATAADALDRAMVSKRVSEMLDKATLLDKSNMIPFTFVNEFCQRFPALMGEHLPRLMTLISETTNDFYLKKLLDIVSSMMKRALADKEADVISHFAVVVNTLINVIDEADTRKLKPNNIVPILNIIVNTVQAAVTHLSVDDVKASVDSVAVERVLSALCKKSAKQANKDISKRIIRALEVESELLELNKRKRKEKPASTNGADGEEAPKKKQQTGYLTVANSQRVKPSKSTQVKLDNKNKSKPKKVEEEEVVDESNDIYKQIRDEKENAGLSSSNQFGNGNGKKSNNKKPKFDSNNNNNKRKTTEKNNNNNNKSTNSSSSDKVLKSTKPPLKKSKKDL
eukprot:gene12113-14170_t